MTRDETDWRSNDIFRGVQDGWLDVHVWCVTLLNFCFFLSGVLTRRCARSESVPMSEAGRAHDMLASRKTMGKVVLVPPQSST